MKDLHQQKTFPKVIKAKSFFLLLATFLVIAFFSFKKSNMIYVVISDHDCQLTFKGKTIRCDSGRNGAALKKVEGDGKTPMGTFELREVFYRADKISDIETKLPIRKIEQNYGWCDDVKSDDYNKFIYLPSQNCHSSEFLFRQEDDAYSIIVPLGYNDDNIIKGKGSAIFLHVLKKDNQPTAGCIAIDKQELLELLKEIDVSTKIKIKWRP
jgi:L,D-peptidoglycan transpeptidase YkuD (ErfK/YbiS/YcfS/YnhG family)